MTSVFDRDDIQFQVVVNHEEQYSIWPDYKEVPSGWRTVGKSGRRVCGARSAGWCGDQRKRCYLPV